jgi:hypothetical protein
MSASGSMLRGLAWRKASRSVGNGACVEVVTAPRKKIVIRDSTESGLRTFTCTEAEWRTFADSVKRRPTHSYVKNSASNVEPRGVGPIPSWLTALWPVTKYRPRDRFSPSDAIDAIDRHISRSTETDDYKRRYFEVLQALSGTFSSLIDSVLRVIIALFVCCLIWLAAIVFAIKYGGIPPWVALGCGTGGPTAFILAAFSGVRYWKRHFGPPTDRGQESPETDRR